MQRTKATIKLRYWWPGMSSDILDYVSTCHWCQMRKVDQQPGHLPILAYPAPLHPFEMIHIDLPGEGLPTTKRGNKFILVVKCPLTRATEVFALPDKSAFTVARCIVENIYCRHGAPNVIMSDQGKEFVNEVMEKIGSLLVINQIHTTGANPRSNGLAESHNKVLKDMLASYTNSYQNDWDLYLPIVNQAYMTTVNTQTGYTPSSCFTAEKHGNQTRNGLTNSWPRPRTRTHMSAGLPRSSASAGTMPPVLSRKKSRL